MTRALSWLWIVIVVAPLSPLGCICMAGSPGIVVGARQDTAFVRSAEAIIARTNKGWEVIGLNGKQRRRIFPASYSIHDIADDGRTFALGDKDTNLFVADARSSTGGGGLRRAA